MVDIADCLYFQRLKKFLDLLLWRDIMALFNFGKAKIKTPQERKEESIKILKTNNIKVFEGLPVIEKYEETKIRTKEEIVKRAIALCIVSVYAEGLCSRAKVEENRELLSSLINNFKAEMFFTEKENQFLNNQSPTQEDAINFSWKYECCNVLLWALGYLDSLEIPNRFCDVTKTVRVFVKNQSYELFESKSRVRKKEEILDQADLIYRFNWACVDAKINNQTIDNLDSGVVFERHHTLNWLINYMDQDWDNVSTDT